MTWLAALRDRVAVGQPLSCLHLAQLGIGGAAHDLACQDPHEGCSCDCVRPRGGYRELGTIAYSAAQDNHGPCRTPEKVMGGRVRVDLCCRCWELWPGTAAELISEVERALGLSSPSLASLPAGEGSFSPRLSNEADRSRCDRRPLLPSLSQDSVSDSVSRGAPGVPWDASGPLRWIGDAPGRQSGSSSSPSVAGGPGFSVFERLPGA